MAIIKATKTVDSKNRITIPKDIFSPGDEVWFEITKKGNLVVHKLEKGKENYLRKD